jgi:hypothetical protein
MKLASGQQRTKEDRDLIRRMASGQIEKFCAVLETIWKQADARKIDRAVLLDWCAGLPHPYNDPALALASGATITPPQMNLLVRQCAILPPSLLHKLSEAALYACRNSRDILRYVREDRASWTPVVALWPREVALTLLGDEFHDLRPDTQHSDRQFTEDFFPNADLIQDRIEGWLLGQKPIKLLLEVAPVIWSWIQALPGPEPENNALMAVDVCWCLAHRKFIRDTNINPTPYDETHLTSSLARFSGQYEQLTKDATVLWRSAAQGWQLRLLLELFPAFEFSPSVAQLCALVPFRRWLRTHLDRGDIVARRKAAFKIATADVQTIQFPGREDQKWREEWDGSVLRAAYRGFPAEHPPLLEVFQAYASSSADRAQICLKYLLTTTSDEEFQETLRHNIIPNFLFPCARDAGLSRDQFLFVVRAGAEPASKRSIQVVPGNDCPPFEQRPPGMVAVADYMIALLWFIANRGFTPFVVKLIEKHSAALNMKLKA